MTRQVLQRSAPVNRRHSLMTTSEKGTPRERRRVGEMAGGATAECAAVCLCCPCAVMDLVVLTMYKVPKALCKKALHKRKRQRMLKENDALLQQRPSSVESENEVEPTQEHHLNKLEKKEEGGGDAAAKSEAVELENEMWSQFNGTGFWRSSSQREQQP